MPAIACNMIQLHVLRKRHDGRHEHLLLRRSDDETLYPGAWQAITGAIEEGETAVSAARRELYEETGLHADSLTVIPTVASFFDAKTDCLHLVPVFAAFARDGEEVRLSAEHQCFEWLQRDEAEARLPFPSHRTALRILYDFVLETRQPEVIVRI
jgi:8-oxo-dGTP pyrophosphatase MutT (NUDIX family)